MQKMDWFYSLDPIGRLAVVVVCIGLVVGACYIVRDAIEYRRKTR